MESIRTLKPVLVILVLACLAGGCGDNQNSAYGLPTVPRKRIDPTS